MPEIQTLSQTGFDDKKPINFTTHELTLFKEELDKQFANGNGINIFKTLYSVRYLSMLERCQKQLEKEKCVTFNDEEWESFIEAQEIYLSEE